MRAGDNVAEEKVLISMRLHLSASSHTDKFN